MPDLTGYSGPHTNVVVLPCPGQDKKKEMSGMEPAALRITQGILRVLPYQTFFRQRMPDAIPPGKTGPGGVRFLHH